MFNHFYENIQFGNVLKHVVIFLQVSNVHRCYVIRHRYILFVKIDRLVIINLFLFKYLFRRLCIFF